MARQSKVDQQKAKEARQKKLLLGLVPVLALLVFIQAPKLMHRGGTAVVTSSAAPATVVAPGTPVPSVAAAPSVAGVPTAAVSTSAGLADTDVAPAPQDGQLVAFDLFDSKDPFVQQVKAVTTAAPPVAEPTTAPADAAAAATTPAPTTTAPDVVGITTSAPSADASAAPAVPTTAVAVLTVNGRAERVQRKGDFPAAAPVFHLVSFDAEAARIAIVGGSYADGSATLELPKGKPLTLMNTADGTRYALLYKGVAKVPTSSLAADAATAANG